MKSQAVWIGSLTAVFCAQSATAESRRVVDVELTAAVTKLPPDAKSVDLWIPVPSDGDGQHVPNVEIISEGGTIGVERVFGNRMYHRRFAGPFMEGGEPRATIQFRAERTEVVVAAAKDLAATPPSSPPAELAVYLQPTSMIPIDGRVAEMARTLDLPKGDSIRSARKVYEFLLDRMDYNWLAKGAGRGDVLWACDSKTGDCTDYHSLFVALCRSQGIPADHEFGLPLAKGKTSGRAKFFHCWSRFWVAGVGWVPVDASEADKHVELREYNFGSLSSNFVRMTHGRDVTLEPPQASGPLNMFHGPYAEVDGKPYKVLWDAVYQEVVATQPVVE